MSIHAYPRPADIVLMNAKPTVLAAQTALRRRKVRFSHAALAVGELTYIDSVTDRGVGIGRWKNLNANMRFAAYRIRESDEDNHKRMARMLEHAGKPYNYAFAAKHHVVAEKRFGDAYYCSEYVAAIYTHAELGINPSLKIVAPADLEGLAKHNPFIPLTHVRSSAIKMA